MTRQVWPAVDPGQALDGRNAVDIAVCENLFEIVEETTWDFVEVFVLSTRLLLRRALR